MAASLGVEVLISEKLFDASELMFTDVRFVVFAIVVSLQYF